MGKNKNYYNFKYKLEYMLPNWYLEYQRLVNKSLKKYLKRTFKKEENIGLKQLKKACLYSTKWWKKIRSILAIEFYLKLTWENFKNLNYKSNIIKLSIAIELLHAYSLIHDDLPCIDNDTLRRWKKTVWYKFNESTAILTWDLLNSLAFEILSETWSIKLIKKFWKYVWIKWMLGWEFLDIYYEKNNNKLSLSNLLEIHSKKTWALITFSIIWAIILAWKKIKNNTEYIEFWEKIWLAFQVKDDLLDIEWSVEETWKSISLEWEQEQKGFIYFMWISKSKIYLNKLIHESIDLTKDLNSKKIDFLINYIKNRKK